MLSTCHVGIVVMEAGHPRPCTVLDLLLHIHTATIKFSKKSDPPQLLVTRLADSGKSHTIEQYVSSSNSLDSIMQAVNGEVL